MSCHKLKPYACRCRQRNDVSLMTSATCHVGGQEWLWTAMISTTSHAVGQEEYGICHQTHYRPGRVVGRNELGQEASLRPEKVFAEMRRASIQAVAKKSRVPR